MVTNASTMEVENIKKFIYTIVDTSTESNINENKFTNIYKSYKIINNL